MRENTKMFFSGEDEV